MATVSPSPMTFNLSDNDLARHLGLLGEQLDPSLSQEFTGLPSVDFSALMNPEVPSPAVGEQKQKQLSRAAEDAENDDDLSDAQSDTDSDAESVDSDGNATTDAQQDNAGRAYQRSLPADLPASAAILASSSLGMLPVSSVMMPLRATSPPPLRVSHGMPETSQGFVALTDLNTASCQANSHSLSSSPSSARGGGSSMMLGSAKPSNGGTVLGKRKAEQSELDTILDPAEKKKQRRLAKNRATAALSRERKKAQLQVLQQRVRVLEQENSSLSQALSMRDAEIRRLKDRATGQPKGAECNQAAATTEVAKNPGPRIIYPAVSSLPRIYRSVANPPSSSFPYQPRAPPSSNLPVGATTHYPQRSVFSAPIIEHACSDHYHQPHTVQSHPVHPTHSMPVSQSVHPVQSVNPSQSVQQSQSVPQSVPQSGAQGPAGAQGHAESAQQEASSRQVTSQVTSQQVTSSHGKASQAEASVSIQPSAQTPFNVVTSGESQPIKGQGSKSSPEKARTLQHASSLGGSFSKQVSPFVAQADNQVHIQQSSNPNNHPAPSDSQAQVQHQAQSQNEKQAQCLNTQQSFQPGNLSRSGSFTYASAYPPACFPYPTPTQQDPCQDQANYASIQSLMSTQGSSAWASVPQHHHQQQQQQRQQQQRHSMGLQSWPGYDEGHVRTSPRHPGWQMQGEKYASAMDHVPYSSSSQWDGSSQFSPPSDWQEQQAWQHAHQHSDASGSWAGPSAHPPWPPQAIAVTPQGTVFGHTRGPLTEPHRLVGDLDPPVWVNHTNPALAGMFPAMPEMPRMPTMDLTWRNTDFAGLERLDPDILPDM